MNGRLLLLAALAAAAAGQKCDYSSPNNNNCLKSPTTARTTIPFSPLFSTPPTFVYGVDELTNATEIRAAREKDKFGVAASYSGPVLKVAWWLEYANHTLDLDRAQNRHYYAFALEAYLFWRSSAADDANGCAGLLGADCVRELEDLVASSTFAASRVRGGMGNVLGRLTERPLRNLSCPAELFGTWNPSVPQGAQAPLHLDLFDEFATVRDDGPVTPPPPSGNASFTHVYGQLRYRSLEEHREHGFVAVTVSWPVVDVVDGEPLNYTVDDVTVETACLWLPAPEDTGGESGGSGENSESGGDGENGAPSYRVGGGLVAAVVGMLVVLLQI